MQTEQDLIDFLTGRAEARWQEGQPYYLSLIATELKERGDDYKPIIGDERLKLFVRRVAEQGGFKVIEHPTQRAKVAIVPAKAEFSFSDEEPRHREVTHARVPTTDGEHVLISFLKALSKLPDTALNEIHIPTKVLVKLVARR